MAELAALQNWMLARIVSGDLSDADAVLAQGGACPAHTRLAIYAHGYRQRLLECLRDDFPLLRRLSGEEAFNLFAQGYIAACPSTSFTLYDFAARFADHLAATRPPGTKDGDLEAIPAELARLERAIGESKRAQGVEGDYTPLAPELLMVSPHQALRRPGTVRLLRLAFDFTPLMAAEREDRAAEIPYTEQCRVAVARQNWQVSVHRLDELRFAFLEAIGDDGAPFGAAAAETAARCGLGGAEALAQLAPWLVFAGEAGLVCQA